MQMCENVEIIITEMNLPTSAVTVFSLRNPVQVADATLHTVKPVSGVIKLLVIKLLI